jgi:hypothetical protein
VYRKYGVDARVHCVNLILHIKYHLKFVKIRQQADQNGDKINAADIIKNLPLL